MNWLRIAQGNWEISDFFAFGANLQVVSPLKGGSGCFVALVHGIGGWFLDRFGKGIGTPARDTLIFESSEAKYRGSAFGSIVLSIRWVPW
ncbi:MAG: hypothetical protein A4E65_00906 [Syntrophorhabdus sp. PtaU1.Bin153]|nr:MAG: hypothetical protein A4E65_00906 [Syntrophorhabdus sp. PtaU1.Bin153]